MSKLPGLSLAIAGILGALTCVKGAQTGLAYEEVKFVWELSRTKKDYIGVVQQATVDLTGEKTHLATLAFLYQVKDGRAEVIAERPRKEAQLLMAPGGTVYAWLMPQRICKGLFSVALMNIEGKKLADLKLDEFPYGFGTLYLGHQGNLVVTESPLDDWEGIHGRFRYVFWNPDGKLIGTEDFPVRRLGILDSEGTAILLIGQEEVTAFSALGEQLWHLNGKFRKAALGGSGAIAVLNPASLNAIDEVHIFRGCGKPIVIKVPTPVHDIIISPDGSLAVIVGDMGRYFYLDTNNAELGEGKALPFEEISYIMDAELVDMETLALGVLHRVGEPPKHNWPRGSVVVINRTSGDIIYKKTVPIRQATAYVPRIDVTFGSRFLVCMTDDITFLVELK